MKKKMKNSVQAAFIITFSFIMGGIITLGILKFTPIMSYIVDTSGTVITKNETQVYEKNSLAPSVEKIYDAKTLEKILREEKNKNG